MKKKHVIIGVLLFSIFSANAQHESKTVQARFGLGAGLYVTEKISTLTIGSVSFHDKDSSVTLTNIIPLELMLGLSNNFALGLHYTHGLYIEDSLQAEARENIINTFGVAADFYIVNRQKFNMYFSAVVSHSFLNLLNRTPILTHEYKYNGFGMSFGIASNIHIFPFLCLNTKIGYDGKQLHMYEWKINGNIQNISNLEVNINKRGVHAIIGLNIIF